MPQLFDRSLSNLPAEDEYTHYRRTKLYVKAIRIAGPFVTVTREGPLTCDDGWLAIDSEGWPYPIANEEMKKIYDVEHPLTPDEAAHVRNGEPTS